MRIRRVLRRTEGLAPRTPRERVLAVVVVAMAAVVEECACRGVAFTLLTWYTGNAWIAAVLSATAFGLAHLHFWYDVVFGAVLAVRAEGRAVA